MKEEALPMPQEYNGLQGKIKYNNKPRRHG